MPPQKTHEKNAASRVQTENPQMPCRILPLKINVCLIRFPFLPLCDAAAANLVQKIDNHVVFLNPEAVKVLPYCIRELVLALSSQFLPPCDRRGVEPDAPGLSENPLVDVVLEGGRGVEAVRSAVFVKDVARKCRPLELLQRRKLLDREYGQETGKGA